MSFGVPLLLVTLVFVPVLLGIYVWQLRRRRRQTVRYSNVALLRAAGAGSASWSRHVPVGLVLCALALLGLGECAADGAGRGPDVELDDHPGARRVRVDVRDRCRAEPAERGAGGRAGVRAGAGRRDEGRARGLLRVRAARGGADRGPGRAAGGYRRGDDGAWDDDRGGDPAVDRRDRRAGPERGAGGPGRRADDGRARSGGPDSCAHPFCRWGCRWRLGVAQWLRQSMWRRRSSCC